MLKEKLNPEFSNQKSFYGKAIVLRTNEELMLQSYNTIVCGTKRDGKLIKYWDGYSVTSMKHIKEFAKQFCRGLEVNKKEWDNLPLSN